jgi:HlyD family secretion protein
MRSPSSISIWSTWSRKKRIAAAVTAALVALLAAAWMNRAPPAPAADAADAADSSAIVARGRIEPSGRVHEVQGPSTGGTIAELRVTEGDVVSGGDILAVLDTHAVRLAETEVAERDVELARRELAQVSAGAKKSEIAAQRSMVEVRRAQLAHAQQQLERTRGLLSIGGTSNAELEQNQMDLEVAQRQLLQASSQAVALSEVRPADVQVAQARIEQARARLKQARQELERTLVRAPVAGTVLALKARSGASLGSQGLLSLGDMRQPMVVAEFDETDAASVIVGSPVTIVPRGASQPLHGRVAKVLNYVFLNDRPSSEVLKGRDARIVEAEIHFDPEQRVPALAGLEVTVTMPTQAAAAR